MEHSFLRKLTHQLEVNFPKSILVLCFIPRMRFWAPVISNILQVTVRKFLKYDLLSLSLFTSLYLTLGFYFHKSLELVLMEMETLQNILFIVVITLLTLIIILFIRKKHPK